MSSPSNWPSEVIGYGRHLVDDRDIDAVVEVLRSDRLTQGPVVPAFEADLERATGAAHAVAVTNGTAALHLVYHALGVGPGRGVLTSANTFLATATAAHLCGGEPEFLDIDSSTFNLDVQRLEERLATGAPPHVVTAVHFAGLPCDMERLISLKRRYGFHLVEDAAHALGARYRVDDRWYGIGEHPSVDAAILSFHPVKHITTAEGGAILTSDVDLAERVRRLSNHGQDPESRVSAFGEQGPRPSWFTPMVEPGFNYRLSDLHAALGRSQIVKLPAFLKARRKIAAHYLAELRDFELPDRGSDSLEHAWHLFVVRTSAEERDATMQALRRHGIQTQLHYYPVPLQPWYRARHGPQEFPAAREYARRAISLPISPSLTEEGLERVVSTLHSWRREGTRA